MQQTTIDQQTGNRKQETGNIMTTSNYVSRYIDEAKRESRKTKEPWLKEFLVEFSRELIERSGSASSGDRYVIAGAFARAIQKLIPDGLEFYPESSLGKYIDLPNLPEDEALRKLLTKKKIDFAIKGNSKTLLIEFKTNVQFNDVAAAMVEMMAVKKFANELTKKSVSMGSLHLFPYRTNVDGLRLLNTSLERPLDHIWILCTPDLQYDIDAISSFRNDLLNLLD